MQNVTPFGKRRRFIDARSSPRMPYWSFMFHLLEKRVADAFAARIRDLYDVAVPVLTEQPKQTSFGEIAVPAAFQLARQLKKAPRAIAQELAAAMGPIEGVTCAFRISDIRIFDDCQRSYRANRMVAHAPQTAATITLNFVLFLINTASFLYPLYHSTWQISRVAS
jgi:hypothetical protein